MKLNKLFDEYSPDEARRGGELKFLEWLFIAQQIISIIAIVAVLVNLFPLDRARPLLNIFTQSGPWPALLVLLTFHVLLVILLLFLKRAVTYYILLGWLAILVVYSVEQLVLVGFDAYTLVGIGVCCFWFLIFLTSRRLKLRLLYPEAYNKEVLFYDCPHCHREVTLDMERCNDEVSDEERFEAFTGQIKNLSIPMSVRAGKIRLLGERFSGGPFEKKSVTFLKQLYDEQQKAPRKIKEISLALAQTLTKLGQKLE